MSETFSALDRQRNIYLRGVGGRRPLIPITFAELEKKAEGYMTKEAFAYVAGGAGAEQTMTNNTQGFARWRIVPRMLRDVSVCNLSIDLAGQKLFAPLLLSPVGVLEMAHREADVAVGRAAASLGIPYVFSNQASKPMESVAAVMKDQPHWFQLYWSRSDDLVASFARRAEACGCNAIVVTLDTTMLGWRPRDLDLAYLPFLRGKGIAQYTSDPVFRQLMEMPPPEDAPAFRQPLTIETISSVVELLGSYPGGWWQNLRTKAPMKAVRTFIRLYTNPALHWEQLARLREYTQLPIWLKGILHPDDARRAIDLGINGIYMSNHGGRQVDGAIGTIEALPAVVEAVKKQIPIVLDSGVRSGADMFKALALGATAVGIGRPYVYGLALAGEQGVKEVICNLLADFELNMRLAGCRNIQEIQPETLCRI